MNSSLLIARLFGIPVRVHWTFALLLAWLVFANYQQIGVINWSALSWTLLSIGSLFACVLLHELGHALMARRYGVATRNIMLLPIGGLAMLDRLPDKPRQELLVALAGPAVNLFLSLLFIPLLLLSVSRDSLLHIIGFWLQPQGNFFLQLISPFDYFMVGLVTLNAMVALFNLIPAFPMDGGRILRAALSMRLPRMRATWLAVRLGQLIALFFTLYYWGSANWPILLVGAFVFLSAESEWRQTKQEDRLRSAMVAAAARFDFSPLYVTDTLGQAAQIAQQSGDRFFVVFDEWHNLKGAFYLDDFYNKNKTPRINPDTTLKDLVQPVWNTVQNNDTLHAALDLMQRHKTAVVPVINRNGKVEAVIDAIGIQNWLRRKQ